MNNISVRILRFGFFILFLWFGWQQVANPHFWTGYLPSWTGYFPVPAEMLVRLNGWFEIIASLFLLSGTFVRFFFTILSLHLLGGAIIAGGAIGVRDAILATIGAALAFSQPDSWTIDYLMNQKIRVNLKSVP